MKTRSSAPLIGICLALAACSSAVTPTQMSRIKPGMRPDQVQAILGRPVSIEHSESADQTIAGEVDHYAGTGGEGRVVLVNHVVYTANFAPAGKS